MKMTVKDRSGRSTTIDGREGSTLMELIRDQGPGEILGLCGGCCSCATCHIYVHDIATLALPPMSSDESDLLDGSSHRTARSRLACQLPFDSRMAGIVVEIAPED